MKLSRPIVVLLLMGSLGACSSSDDAVVPNLTTDIVIAKEKVLSQSVLKAFPSGTTLHQASTTLFTPCSGSSGAGSEDPVQGGTFFDIKVTQGTAQQNADAFFHYWHQQGWKLINSKLGDKTLILTSPKDHFILNMSFGLENPKWASLIVGSPCFKPPPGGAPYIPTPRGGWPTVTKK